MTREWIRMKEASVVSANTSSPTRQMSRQIVIAAADILKALGHSGLDRVLLEFGLPDEDAGKGGGLMERVNSLSNFAFQNPDVRTTEGKPIAEAIVDRALQLFRDTGAMSPNVSDTERRTFQTLAKRGGFDLEKESQTTEEEDERLSRRTASPAPVGPGARARSASKPLASHISTLQDEISPAKDFLGSWT